MEDQPLTGGDVVKVVAFILLFLPPTLLGVGVVPTIFLLGGYYLMRRNGNYEYFASGISATRIYLSIPLFVCSLLFVYSSYPHIWGVGAQLEEAKKSLQSLESALARDKSARIRSTPYISDLQYYAEIDRIPAWYIDERSDIEAKIEELGTTLESSFAGRVSLDREITSDRSGGDWDNWFTKKMAIAYMIWSVGCALYLVLLQLLLVQPIRSHRDWVAAHGVFSGKSANKDESNAKVKQFSVVRRNGLKNYSIADELLKWAALKEAGHITEEEFQAARARLIEEG